MGRACEASAKLFVAKLHSFVLFRLSTLFLDNLYSQPHVKRTHSFVFFYCYFVYAILRREGIKQGRSTGELLPPEASNRGVRRRAAPGRLQGQRPCARAGAVRSASRWGSLAPVLQCAWRFSSPRVREGLAIMQAWTCSSPGPIEERKSFF
ncbi:hypothetical protein VPH35_089656 [Triticum aestivum]